MSAKGIMNYLLPMAVAVSAAVAVGGGLGSDAAGEAGPEAQVHGRGRVSLTVSGNCSLGEARSDGGNGLSWPGKDGVEFLGSGGFGLRFMLEGVPGVIKIFPWEVEPVGGVGLFCEGCEGGKRYPNPEADDDGDGAVDEDAVDGLDNDGDGLIDEDFAAVGDEMMVTRGFVPGTGISITQRSYTWGYGHVRDFVGFTTDIEYRPGGDDSPDIIDLDLAQFVDFRIGRREDLQRGNDDGFFFLRDGEKEYVVAQDAAADSHLAAVVMLGVTAPDLSPLGYKAGLHESAEAADSIWNDNGDSGGRWGIAGAARAEGGANAGNGGNSGSGGGLDCSRSVSGDFTVVQHVERLPRLHPGGRVRIDWAIVFGRSPGRLAKNIRMARETFNGIVEETGETCRWVVPARKAVRVRTEARLAPVWLPEGRRPAISIRIPGGADEEVEWVKVNGEQTEANETAGGRVMIPIDQAALDSERSFSIEGQLSDGTIFSARIDEADIAAFGGDDTLSPDRLPRESLRLYPNPFVDNLNITLRVYEPSRFSSGGADNGKQATSTVRVYDVKGRLVRVILDDGFLHPGDYSTSWDGLDENGAKVAPGVYYCKLQTGERSLTKRVILLR